MTNSKHTKRALLSSVIALILCCSMLVGTTFAWFTDSVESMNNVITAGNLDVEVTQNNTDIREIELFDDILWEPGVVAYENITVENVGTLALQYDLFINFGKQNYVVDAQGNLTEYDLSDVLQVAIVPEGVNASNRDTLTGSIADWTLLKELKAEGKLYPEGNADQFASVESFGIVIWWKPGAEDNNWNVQNGKSTTDGEPLHINLGVNVYAQQLSYEEDSFNNEYDLMATNPEALVNVLGSQSVAATWGMGGSDVDIDSTGGLPLDCTYQFLPTQTAEEAAASGYGLWHADFVVTTDRDITEGQAAVAGYYSAFCDGYNDTKWVALSADLAANTPVRLVEGMGNGAITVNYSDLCYYSFLDTNTKDGFWCGAWADESLNGMTLTVELRLYEVPAKGQCANGGGCNHPTGACETGEFITVATYTHTFSANASGDDSFEDAVQGDSKNIVVNLTDDVTYDIGAWNSETMGGAQTETITINGNGHTITFNSTNNDWTNIVTNGAKLIINNATITNAGPDATSGTWNGHDIYFNCPVELNNVTSLNAIALGQGGVFNNVKITDDSTSDAYMLWIRANGQTVSLTNCVIDSTGTNGSDRGIKIDEQYLAADEVAKVTLNINNVKFTTEKKAAILVKSAAGAEINVDGIDISGVAADTVNAVWVDSDAAAHADKVVVNGASVIVEP